MGGHPNGTSVTHATPEGIPAGHDVASRGAEGTSAEGTSAEGAPIERTPADEPERATGGWLAWAVGTRVVVRRRLPEGGYGDVLGDLLEVGPGGVVVATRRGPVCVAAADIALGKPVPPPPPPRAPRASDGDAGRDVAAVGEPG